MNRLQKKCLISTVGIHLLLLAILIVGPAFFNPEAKLDNSDVLTVIPSTLLDNAANSGVQNAQPPPPTPAATPTVQPLQPIPLPPKIVQPPAPAPTPPPTPLSPSLLEKFEKFLTSKPEPTVKPDLTPAKPQPQNNIKVDLTKVKRPRPQNVPRTDNAANVKAIDSTLKSLSKSLSSATRIDVPGSSSVAYANYANVVRSVYEQALQPNLPSQVARNNENTKVRVVIASDGTVISSEIISPSGDSSWDDSVQRTLNQVTVIAPFPNGATEKERTYTINFNPEVERQLE